MTAWLRRATIAALLLALGGQALWAVFTNSSTFDEANHITRGYVIWRTGDFRLSISHPPLANLLSGGPLLFAGTPALPLAHGSWRERQVREFAHRFFWESGGDGQTLTVLGRLPIVLLTLLLALLVHAWATRLYGERAGLLAVALCAFEPNLLAHGSLATTDLGVTLFSFLTVYLLWRFVAAPSPTCLIAVGVALGAAQLCKFSALLLAPILAMLIAIALWHPRTEADSAGRRLRRGLLWVVLVMAIGFAVIWVGYGLQSPPALQHPARPGVLETVIRDPALRGRVVSALEQTPLPARQYFVGLADAFGHQESGHAAYLLGQTSQRGWWYYFLIAFLVKTPVPLLILLAWAIVGARHGWKRDEWFLVAPVALIMLSTFTLQINIGLRHVLPAYPFLIVFASRMLREPQPGEQRPRRWPVLRTVAVAVLMTWCVGRTLQVGPSYLAYFNEIAGGPEGGRHWLVDSNLDWGQDLIRLRELMRRRGIERIKLSYFGSAPPEAYGINCERLAGVAYRRLMSHERLRERSRPTTGWIAISVTCLENIRGYVGDDISFEWLRAYRPVDRAGQGILLYHVPEAATEGR